MSRCARIVVLAEDKRQQQLINKYLTKRGFRPRQLRFIAAPVGETQNVGYVIERYAAEVHAVRSASYSVGLIVVVDAHEGEVIARKEQLDARLRSEQRPLRVDGEAIALVVPRRNVETTWIWHLESHAVDEETDYKGKEIRSGHDMIAARRQFAAFVITGREPFPALGCPPSLQEAREELLRVPHQ